MDSVISPYLFLAPTNVRCFRKLFSPRFPLSSSSAASLNSSGISNAGNSTSLASVKISILSTIS